MYKERSWLKRAALIASMVAIGGTIGYWYTTKSEQQDYRIYLFNDDERDIRGIEKMFERDLYWLTTRDEYDVRAMLTRRTSEYTNPNVNDNLYIYIMRDKKTDDLIGFVAFYRLSFYKGDILFVSVNPEFRGKRYGEVLTRFALDKMKEMGMMKTTLFTRLDNKPARRLYERMGFEVSSYVGDYGLYYDIYLD